MNWLLVQCSLQLMAGIWALSIPDLTALEHAATESHVLWTTRCRQGWPRFLARRD